MAKYICDILGDYINEVVLRGPTSMYINMDRPFKTISVSSHPGEVEFHYDGGDWFFYMTKECNFISNDCWVENPEAIKGFCEHCIVTKNEHEKEVEEDKKWSTNPITNYKGFYKVDVCGSTMWERSIFFNPDTNEFFETQTMYCDCDGYEHFPKNCCPLYYMPRNKQVEQQFHNARTRTELDFEEVVARN